MVSANGDRGIDPAKSCLAWMGSCGCDQQAGAVSAEAEGKLIFYWFNERQRSMKEETKYLMADASQIDLMHKFAEEVSTKTAIEANQYAKCLNCDFFEISTVEVSSEAMRKDEKIGLVIHDSCKIIGSCRRFPPALPPPESSESRNARFPVVNYRAWCGEHRQTHDDQDIVDGVIRETLLGDPERIWDLNTKTGEMGSFVIEEYNEIEDIDPDCESEIKLDFVVLNKDE
jgi:hypothetical protein